MAEHPDHPHQAAVHLMKALRCCRECYEVSEADLLEIKQLEYRKELLAQELRSLSFKTDSLADLKREIKELEVLVYELRNENSEAERIGVEEITRMSSERMVFQNEQREGILVELKNQKHLTQELTLQVQALLERIKYLNRINNELIYNFCT